MSYVSEVLSDSPVFYWQLNEANSSTPIVEYGSVSGTPTKGAAATLGVTGKYDKGVQFANSTTGGGHISKTLSKDVINGSYSVEVWIKTSKTDSGVWMYRDGPWAYLSIGGTGKAAFYHMDAGGALSGTTTVSNNAWHHVVATFNRSTLTAKVYVDGVLEATGTRPGDLFATDRTMSMGDPRANNFSPSGSMDEFAVYNHELSAARIAAHFNPPAAVSVSYAATPVTINVSLPSPVNVTPAVAVVNVTAPQPLVETYIPVYGYREEVIKDGPLYLFEFNDTWASTGSRSVTTPTANGDVTFTTVKHKGMSAARVGPGGYIHVPGIPAAFSPGNSTFTFETWVNMEQTDPTLGWANDAIRLLQNQTFFPANGSYDNVVVVSTPRYGNGETPFTADVPSFKTVSGGGLTPNVWAHVVFVKDGTNIRLYVNGSLVGERSDAQATFTLGNTLKFGEVFNDAIGYMVAPAVYPNALSAERISIHYNASDVAGRQKNVFYTAEKVNVDVSAGDVTVDTLKSVAYPAQLISTDVNASGHGWHVQRTVTLDADPSIVNLTSANHVGAGNFVVTVNASPVTIELSTPVASVEAADSVSTTAESVVIDVTSLDARGGDPNKNMLFETVEAIVLTPNGAYAVGGHDEYVSADVTDINVSINEPSVSNMTDVLIQATQIGVKIKLVGFYNREEDKWADYVETTAGKESVWHRFHETEGTIAYDELPGAPRQGGENGYYFGSPTLGVTGFLDDRTGVHLHGGDDYIRAGRAGGSISGYSQELLFRTTDTGLLMAGDSREESSQGNLDTNHVPQGPMAGIEVTESGIRVFADDEHEYVPYFWDVNKKVNDGQWHQVVWFQEDPSFAPRLGLTQWTLMIDGEVVLSRQPEGQIASTPRAPQDMHYIDMVFVGGAPKNASIARGNTTQPANASLYYGWGVKNIEMDVMEYINRGWSGFSRDMATRSWRILMGYTIVDATPASVSVAATSDAKAKGNTLKMLIITGGWEIDGAGKDISSWSGARAPGIQFSSIANGHFAGYYTTPPSGRIGDYISYSIDRSNRTLGSAAPLLKPSSEVGYYDDVTGSPRFIDLEKDFAVDITEFDVIHVLHWPDDLNMADNRYLDDMPSFQDLSVEGLAERSFALENAKRGLIRTLRYAVDKGVGLWIANPQQAVDMGIAEGYEQHSKMTEGGFPGLHVEAEGVRQRTLELENEYARLPLRWDLTHPKVIAWFTDFDDIKERVIVSEAEGFSEFPTSYVGEAVHYEANADWQDHNTVLAFNNEHRPDGLKIGTKFTINTGGLPAGGSVHDLYEDRDAHWSVYSLTPNNIKGQIIAKEQPTVLKGTVEIENPWKDNVTTVLLEKGTILDGRPIGGRIFVETQDNFRPQKLFKSRGASNHEHLYENDPYEASPELKRVFNGGNVLPGESGSKWASDSRRFSDRIVWVQTGFFVGDNKYYHEVPTSDSSELPDGMGYGYVSYPYFGMNDRGLRWLGVKPEEEFGQAMVYPEAVKVTVKANHPEVAVVRHAGFSAQAAEVRIEFRKPTGLADPDVTVNVTPVRITVIGGTYQRIVSAGVATITVTGTFGEQITGSGEDHIVYLRNESITLYLGED